ncbi:MAG: hypothetical protein M3Q28_01160 [Pseudomonadota bacterium]|nr:hypothetical protein [Pseudomonadota bacterium]
MQTLPHVHALLGAALLTISISAAAAISEGRTANDRGYVSGGIGLEESERMKQMADKFSLQLIVSSRSGAYLADTQVTILNASSQKILDIQLNAPWLLVDLAPGTYRVLIAHAGSTQERNVTLTGKLVQLVVQFAIAADSAKNPVQK